MTWNESDSALSFLPSFRVLISVSVPRCRSLCLSALLPASVSQCLSPHHSCTVPSLSPWLNHLNHCVLVTQPGYLAVAASQAGTAPELHTRAWMPVLTTGPQAPPQLAPNISQGLRLLITCCSALPGSISVPRGGMERGKPSSCSLGLREAQGASVSLGVSGGRWGAVPP